MGTHKKCDILQEIYLPGPQRWEKTINEMTSEIIYKHSLLKPAEREQGHACIRAENEADNRNH